ncbi:MAG: hypothetical protein JWN86_76 [Planctomycetota bacterium]|nr:hypothetical protein [Planctomycetota bacterium]
MNLQTEYLRAITRRHFFGQCSTGLGAIALASLLGTTARSQDGARPGGMLPKKPMIPAKAKHVIYLHMAGSPSQLDMFDYKPALQKFTGKPCPKEFLEGKRFAFIRGVPNMLGTPFKFAQHGQSGTWLSETLPQFARVVDDVAVIKTMSTDEFNHAPAQLYMHTGASQLGSPSLGSWTTYGLGTETQDLPGFVVLGSGGKTPDAGKSVWGSGFLPSVYQGVQCRTTGDPVLYVSDPRGLDRAGRRDSLDTLRALNELQAEAIGDPETLTRIEQYELAFRMQVSVPEVMDISREPQYILDLYGARPGFRSQAEGADDPRPGYSGKDASFANNCLLARRLVEKGVRFVQLYDWGWDHHGISPGEDITHTLPIKCEQIDRAVSGLIIDLKQRGLLDETLIVWGGEFGRTPMQQNNANSSFVGRDHHPFCFTMWMAGGGIKGGQTYGETDEIGYYPTKDKMDVRDLQATILQLIGLDPWKFSYSYQGLDQRLIGVEGNAKVPPALLA